MIALELLDRKESWKTQSSLAGSEGERSEGVFGEIAREVYEMRPLAADRDR